MVVVALREVFLPLSFLRNVKATTMDPRQERPPQKKPDPTATRSASADLEATTIDDGTPARAEPPLADTVVADQGATTPAGGKPATAGPSAKPAGKGADKSTQLGDFKLLKRLGKGGMGEVYLARQISLDRDVALKVMAKAIAAKPGFVERFYREARSMAKLDHPNVVRGYAVGEDQGLHFVAMELIDGKSMQDWLNQLGTLSVGDAVHVALRAASALAHAHEQGLIHRDIKPDNMLVTSKGILKVSDLGLAKQVDEDNSMTQSGTGLGTPYYMPPEQARNAKHVDLRSDIYALGSTLYHFLTGAYPFQAESTLELILAKEKGQFPPVRKLNRDVPERLSLIVEKMMAKDPKHRYQTCAEVIRDLESLGVAHDTLSFIEGAVKPAGAARPASAAAAPATASRAGSAADKRADANPAADTWYVKYPNEQGKLAQSKWTTAQVLQILKSGHLDLRAKASRAKEGPFLPLAQHPEFAATAKARVVKEQAEQKGKTFEGLYAQIDAEERSRKRWRWLRQMTESTAGLVSLVVYLAIIAAVIVGGVYGIKEYVYPAIAAKYGL